MRMRVRVRVRVGGHLADGVGAEEHEGARAAQQQPARLKARLERGGLVGVGVRVVVGVEVGLSVGVGVGMGLGLGLG